MTFSDAAAVTQRLRRSHPNVLVQLPADVRRLANATFRTGMRHEPFALALPRSARELSEVVQTAADSNVPVAVQATGHGSPRVVSDMLLISTRHLRDIEVDGQRRVARVAPGVTVGELVEAAWAHGLAPVVGAAPGVGMTGLVLGGGIGPTGRSLGYACDHVRSMSVATTRGLMRVDAADQDLFWALRGGRGNFGVTTSMEVSLQTADRFLGGCLWFTRDQAPEVLGLYREVTRRSSRATTTSLAMIKLPDLETLPPLMRDRVMVSLRVVHFGDHAELDALLRPLRLLGTVIDTLDAMSLNDIECIHQDPQTPGPYRDRSTMLHELADDFERIWTSAAAGLDAGLSDVVEIRHLGGAYVGSDAPAAAVHRSIDFTLFVGGVPRSVPSGDVAQFQASMIDQVAPFSSGGPCPSYMGEDESLPDMVAASFGSMWPRLRRIKRDWDPENIFCGNHNIPPAEGDWRS